MEIKDEYIFLTRIVGESMLNGRRYLQIGTWGIKNDLDGKKAL